MYPVIKDLVQYDSYELVTHFPSIGGIQEVPVSLTTPTAGTPIQNPQGTPRDDVEINEGFQTVANQWQTCGCQPMEVASQEMRVYSLQYRDVHSNQFHVPSRNRKS
eukprot:5904655-Amphidinium_carterae.1